MLVGVVTLSRATTVAAQRVRALSDRLGSSFFVLPAAAVVGAFVAARLLVGVDTGEWVGRSTVDSARIVLSTTAAATITFASIAFSVSLLIMQQGSNQFSPRVIHGLVRDPFNRRVIALVVGTFTYCLVSLQRVRGPLADGPEEVVPELAVAIGLVLGVLSVLAVVAAINHTARQMDVSVILGGIVQQATGVRGFHPTNVRVDPSIDFEALGHGGQTSSIVRFESDGWIQQIDHQGLLALFEPGSAVRLETDVGRYAIRTTPLCTVWPALAERRLDEVARRARGHVRVGQTRTMSEDAGYGVRQLVDIALRALSPGINDPTTAQDAIFHLGTVLVDRLTSAPQPTRFDDDQDRHLLAPHALTDDDLAELALAELRRAASSQPMVAIYLLEMIGLVVEAVTANGSGARVRPLLAQARLVADTVATGSGLDVDRQRVQRAYDAVCT